MSEKNPFLGLGLGSPFLSFVRPTESGGGGAVSQIDTSAAHFWDFSSTQSSPYEDQVGSLEFTTNTSSMATGNTTYGNPPGWSNGAGFFASSGDLIQTAADACFDLSGDFCIDCCVYNTNAAASTSHMAWSQGKSGSYTWYIYNASGDSRFDSADDDYTDRLGEAGSGSTPKHNYVQNKWCVSRLRRSGDTTYVKWFVENSGGTGWDQAPGSPYSGTTTGTGPDGSSNGGFLALNGWTHNGSYSLSNVSIAWLAYYTDGSKTDDPFIPS